VLSVGLSGSQLSLSWPAEAVEFVLESTPTLSNPLWESVPGVVNNSVTVEVTGGAQFYRLRQ
jgi:hypothetical protein